jgi:hypothetical protein
VLQLYRHTDPSSERGYKCLTIGPDHLGYAVFPIPRIGLGYKDQKIIEPRELICAVLRGRGHEGDRRGREVGQGAPLGQARRDLKPRKRSVPLSRARPRSRVFPGAGNLA